MKTVKELKNPEKAAHAKHLNGVKKHSGPKGSPTMKKYHQGELDKHRARLDNRERLMRKTQI